jgi:hypothetical protein
LTVARSSVTVIWSGRSVAPTFVTR